MLTPGSRSTFDGNRLTVAGGGAMIGLVRTGEPQQRATDLDSVLRGELTPLLANGVLGLRVRGL